jgi:tetratricopeptide (TPR) repeat protein
MRTALRLLLVSAGLAACGGAPGHPTPPRPTVVSTPTGAAAPTSHHPAPIDDGAPRDPRVVDLDVIRLRATAHGVGGEVEVDAVATAELFKRANAAAKDGRPDEALALYRQIVAEFPESQFAPVAMFNTAAILDARGDLTATIATLRDLVARYPQAHESIEGHLYIAALQADHKQWPEAVATLTEALARPNLTHADRVEGLARRGYAELELGRLDPAEATLAAALAEWRQAPHLDDPYYIAMAHYYRGELLHRRFAALPVEVPDGAPRRDLDAKARLAAEAYDRWKAALGFHDAYWATASGYQMSQIFVEYWQAVVTAPYPGSLAAAARPRYVAEVHDRVRHDLEKALEGHRLNVELARVFGVETTWSLGSASQAAKILEILAKEGEGSYLSPDTTPAPPPR